jgi:hypothetical protein
LCWCVVQHPEDTAPQNTPNPAQQIPLFLKSQHKKIIKKDMFWICKLHRLQCTRVPPYPFPLQPAQDFLIAQFQSGRK